MTNRQEVAKKLRENSTVHTTDEAYVVLLNCMGITYDYANLFNRLADLIDPTCRPVEADNNIVCSECGADLYDDDLYCPHCGARVVRESETLEQAALLANDYIDNQTLALAT
jgi:hypothetical protein